MLSRASLRFVEALHIAAATLYLLVTLVLVNLLMRLAFYPWFPFLYIERFTGHLSLARRFPMLFLACSALPAAYFAGQGHLPFGPSVLSIVAGTVGWLFLLHIVFVAYGAATGRTTRRIDEYEAAIASRWPDRWYSRHMKKPLNAIFVRLLIANTLVMIPAAWAVIAPGEISLYSVAYFALCFTFTALPHETLDHSDLHMNVFSSRHLPAGGAKLVFWLTNRYLRLVLNPASLRIPGFYRVQHLYMHHVENNGVADIQTTVLHDRTSFFDFARYALQFALSWSFAADVYRYMRRKGNRRNCRLLIMGMASWFAGLGLIALYNPAAAIFFLVYLFGLGVSIAQSVYYWHALADPDDPENLYVNSLNLVPVPGVTDASDLHVLHHEYSGANVEELLKIGSDDRERWRKAGAIEMPYTTDSGLFSKALLARRFDVLADMVAPEQGARKEDLMPLMQHRTRAMKEVPRGETYKRWDRRFAMLMANHLLPGGRLPPSSV